MKDIPKDDIKRRELSYKATKDVLKATNVFPSPQYANNIYNDNSNHNTIISPEFQAFLDFQATNGASQTYHDEITTGNAEKMLEDSDGVNSS